MPGFGYVQYRFLRCSSPSPNLPIIILNHHSQARYDKNKLADILEAAEQLSLEDREDLVRILTHRLREQKRTELIEDIRESEQEFERGECQPVTPEQLMKEIIS